MKCCTCCGPKVRYTALLLVGAVLIALPFGFHDYINKKIREKIADNVKIERGSQIYDQWKKPTIPVYLRIYTFSIINPSEVMAGKPPFVAEKGPYSYRESREKLNISWGDNNVNYNQQTNYSFDPDTSCDDCDSENDVITSVNIPFVVIASRLRPYRDLPGFDYGLSFLLSYLVNEDLFQTRTVNETVWGYKEPLFNDVDKLIKELEKMGYLGKIILDVVKSLVGKIPHLPLKFALQPNPSWGGNTTVNTGEHDIDKVGCYEQWKNHTGYLNNWGTRYANMLNGTDGAIYKPDISKDDILYIFVTQLCRSLNVKYLDGITIQGIDGYRFNVPTYLFESGDINPNNKGFCDPDCLPTGLLSIKSCVPFNAPIIVSQPHFLNGNKTLRQKVHGLSPVEEKHDTFLSLEPNTGILLQASKRIQFNIQVQPLKGMADLENVKPAVVPIMWIDEHVTIDSSNAHKLKKSVLNNLEIIKWVELGLIILGGLMVLIAIILFIRLCCKGKSDTHLRLVAEEGRSYGSVASGNGQSGHLNPSLINASD